MLMFSGSFYFTLGNLSPKYRSKLTSIYLLALVKSTFISTYGMDVVLKPFINDMKKLVCLVCLQIHVCICIIKVCINNESLANQQSNQLFDKITMEKVCIIGN